MHPWGVWTKRWDKQIKKPRLMGGSLGWGMHILMGTGILAGAFPNQQTDGGCVQAKGFAQVVF